ncbi:MAG: HisA/HisF-related TIM barrel protein, partial [Candidatus Ranarchaeia archaeon]
MKVIPVLDILNGLVVHGIQGKREKYRPIKSILSPNANPFQMAKVFDNMGFSKVYLADLDGIQGRTPNLKIYQQIAANTNLAMMVDAGISEIDQINVLEKTGVKQVIVGTETLRDVSIVKSAVKKLGSDRVIVSLDL